MFATAGSHTYYTLQEERHCSLNYFCCGALLIFMGAILFCALGFIVILPYVSTKDWTETRCNVTVASVNDSLCACEVEVISVPTCVERYPCLQIYVTHRLLWQRKLPNTINDSRYDTANGSNDHLKDVAFAGVFTPYYMGNEQQLLLPNADGAQAQRQDTTTLRKSGTKTQHIEQDLSPSEPGNMGDNARKRRRHKHWFVKRDSGVKCSHDTDSHAGGYRGDARSYEAVHHTLLYRSWKDIYYTHCTLHECGDRDWNTKATQQFAHRFGKPNLAFACFVNPRDPHIVIVEKTPFSHMLHAVIWPSVCLVVGLTLWLGLCCGCWSLAPEREPSVLYAN